MIQLKSISKKYVTGSFTQVALDNVDLNFRENEFVAILGPSGSGKTTLLNILGGLDKYDSGDLIIHGISTKQFSDANWDSYRNNSVGFIFQSYNLIPHLSIKDNVEMGMTLSGVSRAKKHAKALEVLEKVGLKDHVHKKPNQLSGGQMQRVAIARALANDPDIILADEPTGALDTQTSEQIMELIKEIAKDKLVVMVTHNPDLANEYATRIVRFSDGKVTDDTDPLVASREKEDYHPKKTSMSFLTALKLSGKNIATKKWRTALTAFASSIGIIGVALVLSLSNGFDKQINSFEKDSLSNFPITINQTATSITNNSNSQGNDDNSVKYPDTASVIPYDSTKNTMIHVNKLTEDYVAYVDKIDQKLLTGMSYTRKAAMNIMSSNNGKVSVLNLSAANFSTYPVTRDKAQKSYLENYYDVLSGSYPSKMTDLVLVVDEYNQVDKNILNALGFASDAGNIDFSTIVGKEFRMIYNDDYYTQNGNYFGVDGNGTGLFDIYNNQNAVKLNICGVIRIKKDVKISTLSAGIVYSDELMQDFIENAKNSKIVKTQNSVDYNVMTGGIFADPSVTTQTTSSMRGGFQMESTSSSAMVQTKEDVLASLGATSVPASISLYPLDFNSKDDITAYLDKWNENRDDNNKIVYTDMAAMITSLSGSIMDSITIVLIAFASISLVVSMIMIAIIIYISVLERTKEIGVLRALGARKKDISRVFNAETFIIGAFSGTLGIVITYLLTIPVNSILYNMTELKNVAQLNIVHAIVLVIISIVLTMIGGFIPSKMAAKKDPVVALRTE